jgi:hypothetical protein
MEAICSSETSIDTQRIARRYIPEDGTLQGYIINYIIGLSNIELFSPLHGASSGYEWRSPPPSPRCGM